MFVVFLVYAFFRNNLTDQPHQKVGDLKTPVPDVWPCC